MSEFRREWPQSVDLKDHSNYLNKGLEVIESQLVLPKDGRMSIAYGALAMGGQQSAVFAEGITSTGKSEFGNVVIGEGKRTGVVATDSEGTLVGVESVVTHEFTNGKLKYGDNPSSPDIFLDEIANTRDTSGFHDLFTGSTFRLPNGVELDMRNASIFSTANFVGGGGSSKRLNDAMRARLGMNFLFGDGGVEHAEEISKFVRPELSEEYRDGLLPFGKRRQQIREGMEAYAPLGNDAAEFMINVIAAGNESGLLNTMDLSNKRILNNWVQAVRAARLVNGSISSEAESITREELVNTASIGLGTIAILSSVASEEIAVATGNPDVLSPVEKGIYARRAITAVATKKWLETQGARKEEPEEEIRRIVNNKSFSSLLNEKGKKGDDIIVDTVLGSSAGIAPQTEEAESRSKAQRLKGYVRSKIIG